MSALQLFHKTNSKRTWNIAAWHSMHSLTWSWILSFSRYEQGARRWRFRISPYRTNGGLQLIVLLPMLGTLQWHRQKPMYWRDIYLRAQREGRITDDAFEVKAVAAMAWEKGFQAGVERGQSRTH